MTYKKFENIVNAWDGKICIFGAGFNGKYIGYEILKAALGDKNRINFYCDNNVKAGTTVHEGIRAISFDELLSYGRNVKIFLMTGGNSANEIEKQLREHEITNIVLMDNKFQHEFFLSIDKEMDKTLIEKYKYFMDDRLFLERLFEFIVGYKLNLDTPRTINEKLQWIKLYDRNRMFCTWADKYAVKEYIKNKLGEQYVIPTLGVYERFSDIDFDSLPVEFVMKCTHDSGSVLVCNTLASFNIDEARVWIEKHLEQNWYVPFREWAYKDIKPRIIIEEYMKDYRQKDSLIDYKFYCFNGIPKLIYVSKDMDDHTKASDIYTDWTEAPFVRTDYQRMSPLPKKPALLDRMLEICRVLSNDVNFLRVDLYIVNEKIYVSELTLYPGAGFMHFIDYSQDIEMGNMLKLNRERK